MSILVAGVTGLVGSRLLQRFAETGVACRALVRPCKEVPEGIARVEGDLLNPDSCREAVKGVSAIVHLAAVFRTQNEDDIWRANVEGTKNLIAAAKAHAPQARFIMASTGLVYDANAVRPGQEDDESQPKMAYPASKLSSEKELRQSGLHWSILRFAFVYGDADGHLQRVPMIAGRFKWHPATTFSMVHHRDIHSAIEWHAGDHLPEPGNLFWHEIHLARDRRVDGSGVNRIDLDTARRQLRSERHSQRAQLVRLRAYRGGVLATPARARR